MLNSTKFKNTFFLSIFLFSWARAMDDKTNKKIEGQAIQSSPGCIRQNSSKLIKMLLELAQAQGNVGLVNELKSIETNLSNNRREK